MESTTNLAPSALPLTKGNASFSPPKAGIARKSIAVAAPCLNGNEKQYLMECLDSTRISAEGKFVHEFERQFANFCGVKHALTCSNGTVAIHLALLAHGLKPNDEVIVPTLTYIATANAVSYCGAKPVFVDSEPDTWNLDPTKIESAITPKTRGIIVVHLYGHPTDMDPILEIAEKYNLFVIEDAAKRMEPFIKDERSVRSDILLLSPSSATKSSPAAKAAPS